MTLIQHYNTLRKQNIRGSVKVAQHFEDKDDIFVVENDTQKPLPKQTESTPTRSTTTTSTTSIATSTTPSSVRCH